MDSVPPSDWLIARLAPEHDRTAFDCGHPVLNDWLKERAGQFDRRDLARTYVIVRAGERAILGYYTISSHRVRREDLPQDQGKGLPRIDVPVVLLGRLAVDQSMHRRGLGSLLLIDALRRVEHLSEQIGIRAIEVDAIDSTAQDFYERFGFVRLLDDPRHLFLPMTVIRKALRSSEPPSE